MDTTATRRLNVHLAHIQPTQQPQTTVIEPNSTYAKTLLLLGIPTVALASAYTWITVPSTPKIAYDRPIELNDVIKAYVRLITKIASNIPIEKLINQFPQIEIKAPIRADREHLENYISHLPPRDDLRTDPILPPFYLNALTGSLQILVMSHPLFPIRMLGAVNSSNEIKIHTPVRREWLENGELSATCRIGDAYLVKRGIEFDLITEVYRKDTIVWSLIFRSIQFIPGVKEGKNPKQVPPCDHPTEQSATYDIALAQDAGRVYGKMGYDVNPIHMSDMGAKMFGFPRVMAHGMWVVAQAEAKAKRNELVDRDSPQLIQVAFKKPTLLPTTVHVTIEKKGSDNCFTIKRDENVLVIEGRVSTI
jgi:acyl dehydratase